METAYAILSLLFTFELLTLLWFTSLHRSGLCVSVFMSLLPCSE